MSYTADIAALTAALPTLTAKNADFAASLLAQAKGKKGLSEKQMYWVRKLATPVAPAAVIPTADLSAIVAMFAKAGGKRPRITFSTADGTAFRLTVAGSQSCAPGAINVTSNEGDYDGKTWFGRILTSGEFQPTRKASIDATPVASALECFAADPAKQAAAYGHRTGSCCFCSLALTDPVSVEFGYGPVCAKRWDLPHR